MTRRCAYCGHPLDGGKKRTCAKHAKLPAKDPHWNGYIGDECGCPDCIQEWVSNASEELLTAVRRML